jgi:hypothetical protein
MVAENYSDPQCATGKGAGGGTPGGETIGAQL